MHCVMKRVKTRLTRTARAVECPRVIDIAQVREELDRWSKGVLVLQPPAPAADLRALSGAINRPLPAEYVSLLNLHNGADLRGDRLFSAHEAEERFRTLRTLIAHSFRADIDWPHNEPPDDMLPIAVDLDGNLKCLDFSTEGPEIVDWYRETGEFNTWHSGVLGWFMTCLRTLAIRFDHRGRPRPLRDEGHDDLRFAEIEAHLTADPRGAHPLLERATILAETSTPEDALLAFRAAADSIPTRALNHYQHARWAIRQGRFAEARSALRRCVAVPLEANPKKHSFRGGYLAEAHMLLGHLYERLGGQSRKADQQHRAAQRASKRYGFQGYDENPEFQELLAAIKKGMDS